ncbi:DUF6678 family protein [Lacibacterium aquatile]|uniref:DUF6678 family protein n=1 Tax=Lacibacterium aquatile TaxID=1168082 RepID=A0ABW5DWY8_9PROT
MAKQANSGMNKAVWVEPPPVYDVKALTPVMNKTKWDELRLAMYDIEPTPGWSTLSDNGYQSTVDGEWYYHFRIGLYVDIIHVDILVDTLDQRNKVRQALKTIHVPGEETDTGFRVFGYIESGQTVTYI